MGAKLTIFAGRPLQNARRLVSLLQNALARCRMQGPNLRRYPACILLYFGGIAAIAAKKYETLRVLLRDNRTSIDMQLDGKDALLIRKLVPMTAQPGGSAQPVFTRSGKQNSSKRAIATGRRSEQGTQ